MVLSGIAATPGSAPVQKEFPTMPRRLLHVADHVTVDRDAARHRRGRTQNPSPTTDATTDPFRMAAGRARLRNFILTHRVAASGAAISSRIN
jgi:hypothetical protein